MICLQNWCAEWLVQRGDHGQRVLVVTPTYNERDNLEALCAAVLASPIHADYMIVDDNSPDGTGRLGLSPAQAGLATSLRSEGVDFDRLPDLAAAAAKQWTGSFNPVEISVDGFRRLYEQAF